MDNNTQTGENRYKPVTPAHVDQVCNDIRKWIAGDYNKGEARNAAVIAFSKRSDGEDECINDAIALGDGMTYLSLMSELSAEAIKSSVNNDNARVVAALHHCICVLNTAREFQDDKWLEDIVFRMTTMGLILAMDD